MILKYKDNYSSKSDTKKIVEAVNTIKYLLTAHGISRNGLSNASAIISFAKIQYQEKIKDSDTVYGCECWLLKKIKKGDIDALAYIYNNPSKKASVKKKPSVSTDKRPDLHVEYLKFLKTPYWQEVRLLVLERDGNKCTKCDAKHGLHVHHTTYRHHFHEKEHIEDLVTLCENHHKAEHKRLDSLATKE